MSGAEENSLQSVDKSVVENEGEARDTALATAFASSNVSDAVTTLHEGKVDSANTEFVSPAPQKVMMVQREEQDSSASIPVAESAPPKKKQKKNNASATSSSSKAPRKKTSNATVKHEEAEPSKLAIKQSSDDQGDVDEDEGMEEMEEEENNTKLYCICRALYNEDRMMIACDRCDEWYHAVCMNVSEEQAELVDMFICPKCQLETSQRTTWKAKCLRDECTHAALQPLSRYCSERCGVIMAMQRIEKHTMRAKSNGSAGAAGAHAASAAAHTTLAQKKKQDKAYLEKLLRLPVIQSAEKREGFAVWLADVTQAQRQQWLSAILQAGNAMQDVLSTDATLFSQQQQQQEMTHVLPYIERLCQSHMQLQELQQERAQVNADLDILSARIKLLHLAEDRVALLEPVRVDELETTSTSKSKKSKSKKTKNTSSTAASNVAEQNGAGSGHNPSATTAQASVVTRGQPRCGYDERLHWDDEAFHTWCNSALGKAMLNEDQPLDGRINEEKQDKEQQHETDEEKPHDKTSSSSVCLPPTICGQAKRNCKRHTDWTIVRGAAFDVESAQQTQRLHYLSNEVQRTEMRMLAIRKDMQNATQAELERIKQFDERMAYSMRNEGKRRPYA